MPDEPRTLQTDCEEALQLLTTVDDIEVHPDFARAREFKETIEPRPGVDYGWVWEYAREKFRRADEAYKEIDDKANDIIKYLGGGTGLFTLAALLNVKPENAWIIAGALPSFVLAVISISLAAAARRPQLAHQPPSIQAAFNFANGYESETLAKANFLGQWHLTCVGLNLAIKSKASRVRCATRFFVLAIIALSIPIGIAIYRGS